MAGNKRKNIFFPVGDRPVRVTLFDLLGRELVRTIIAKGTQALILEEFTRVARLSPIGFILRVDQPGARTYTTFITP